MTVSALSGGAQSPMDIMRQRRAALQQMESAVQSGDIGAAQKSLATVKSLSPQASSGSGQTGANRDGGGDSNSNSNSNSSTSFRSKMKTDLSALEAAVAAGNLADAQGALTKLNADKQAETPPTPPTDPASALGSDMLKLLDAALKGDTSGAQSAAKTVQSDLQSVFGTGTTSDAAASGTSDTSGNSLIDDLKALITAGQGTDAEATKKAAEKFLQDLQQSADGVQGRHHHHGHTHAEAEYQHTMSFTAVQVDVESASSGGASDTTQVS